MRAKERAVQVGRPYTAHQGNGVNNTVFSIRIGKHLVKVEKEIFFDRLGDIFGGILLGMAVIAMSIIIPILFGGY